MWNCENRGGLKGIVILPECMVEEIAIEDENKWQYKIVTKEKCSPLVLPEYEGKDYSYEESEQITEQGEMYNVSIQGFVPSQYVKRQDMERMKHTGVIVLTMDNLGECRVFGSKEVPLTFSASETVPSNLTAAKGHTFLIEGIQPECSRFISHATFNIFADSVFFL